MKFDFLDDENLTNEQKVLVRKMNVYSEAQKALLEVAKAFGGIALMRVTERLLEDGALKYEDLGNPDKEEHFSKQVSLAYSDEAFVEDCKAFRTEVEDLMGERLGYDLGKDMEDIKGDLKDMLPDSLKGLLEGLEGLINKMKDEFGSD